MNEIAISRSEFGLQPCLPDGTQAPSGLESVLLGLFDLSTMGDNSPKIASQLHAALMSLSNEVVTETRFAEAVKNLQSANWIEEVPCPEPEKPRHVRIPGHADIVIPPLLRPDAPQQGDTCLVITALGAKAARLCNDLRSGGGLWRLGSDTEADQILLAFLGSFPRPFSQLDAALCTTSCEKARAALDQACAANLVEAVGNSYRLTRAGEIRRAELEIALRTAPRGTPQAIALSTPSEGDCLAILQGLSEAELTRLVLVPLLRAMGFSDVRYNNGPMEYGKDILAWKYDELGAQTWLAIVAKCVDISGSVVDHAGARAVVNQVQQVFEHEFVITRTATRARVARCWVVTSGNLKHGADFQIEEAFRSRPYFHGSTRFLFGCDVVKLVTQYGPKIWTELSERTGSTETG